MKVVVEPDTPHGRDPTDVSDGTTLDPRTVFRPFTADHPEGSDAPLSPGDLVDRFVLGELLGQGGMGRVYRAYDPRLRRDVALKLLRHADTRQGEARMLREAQAMARLNHPNILPIFDVGRHGNDVFITMELVEGKTLAQWLRERRRGWDELQPVLAAAGRGLQAAHAAGLVHRDFKPSNVMIGDDGRVRVMDLGLARLMGDAVFASDVVSDVGSSTLDVALTRTGHVAGSPPYMAPEQHEGRSADARSDQYSFCVVLWEALFRERPFQGRNLDQIYAAKLRHPPPIPDEPLVPRWLHAPLLRGLSVDPADRFGSMDALLLELPRRPARIRRRGMVLVSLAVVSVVLLATRSVEPVDDVAPCSGARARLDGVWDDAARQRVAQAVRATAVSHAGATWQRLEPALDRYADGWARAHTEACLAARAPVTGTEDDLDARMRCLEGRRRELAALLRALEHVDDKGVDRAIQAVAGLPSIDRCADPEQADREAPVPDDPRLRADVELLRDELADASASFEAGRTDDALTQAQRILDRARGLGYGPLTAQAELRVGSLHDAAGHYDQAVELLRAAYFEAEAQPGIQARAATALFLTLGMHQMKLDEAEPWTKHAQAAVERTHDPELRATLLANLAGLRSAQARTDESLELLHEALSIRERLLGPDHLDVAALHNNLGVVHYGKGDYERSLASFGRAAELEAEALGPRHPQTARALGNTGAVYEALGRYDEALDHYRRALEILGERLGPRHPTVAMLHNNIGVVLEQQDDLAGALEHFQLALEIREAALGPQHSDTATSIDSVGNVYQGQGRYDQAVAHHRRALEIREQVLGAEHPEVAVSLNNLGTSLLLQGHPEQALALYERGLRIREQALGPDHPRVATSLINLGEAQRALAQPEPALQSWQRARAILVRAQVDPGQAELLACLRDLGVLLVDLGRLEEAIEPLEQATAPHEGERPSPARARARFALARALEGSGREPQRARELAAAARADFVALGPGHEEDLARIDAWP